MTVTNLPKAVILGLLVTLAGIALLIGRISFVEFSAISGPALGYVLGNGVAALRGQPVTPVIGSKPSDPPTATP